jgi:TPR repeat protein
MSALKNSSRFKRVLLFAVASWAVAGIVSAQVNPESAEIAALRAKAEKGNGVAQYNLGLIYAQGRDDLPSDAVEAFVWLSLAAENGTTGKALESVIGKLTDEQLADSRRRLAYRRIALSSAPAAPAGGATRVGGAVKASTGGFNLSHSPAAGPPTPDSSAPKAASPEPSPSRTSPAATPPLEPTPSPAPAADVGQDLRDPSSGLLQIIGNLRDEKQQLGVELTQARNELVKTRAELAAVNAELAGLKGNVARLEADVATAKLTETRLTIELKAARLELSAPKSSDETEAAVKPKTDDHPNHLP